MKKIILLSLIAAKDIYLSKNFATFWNTILYNRTKYLGQSDATIYHFFSHSDYTTFADRNTVVAKNLVVDLTERGLIAVIMPRRSKSEMCVLAR